MDVLVVSAHADDETLGCGGTLLRHRAGGDDLSWALLSTATEGRWSRPEVERRRRQVDVVAAAYGMREVVRGDFPAGRLDTVPVAELMEVIAEAVERTRPEVVYVVHGGDVHTDHTVAFRATMSVLKPFHLEKLGVRRVLAYETLSSTEAAAMPSFLPNLWVDVSAELERKLELLALYETEAQEEPLPRSASAIRALARYRGATIGVEYAEAFALVRELV
jgi:LmbE family N-acetylglucosaminyl deacetylase